MNQLVVANIAKMLLPTYVLLSSLLWVTPLGVLLASFLLTPGQLLRSPGCRAVALLHTLAFRCCQDICCNN